MAKHRDKNPKHNPATRIVSRGKKKAGEPGRVPDGAGPSEETRVVGRKQNVGSTPAAARTKVVKPKQPSPTVTRRSEEHTRLAKPFGDEVQEVSSDDPMSDPVVGWLVVIEGPGRGGFVRLGYGVNSIGRDPEERVSLNFGDEEISRSGHASLTYDGRGRKYYLQHGKGTNLTYVGEEPVLTPRELGAGDEIGIGGTVLRFIPFCGSDFEWDQ